MKQQFKYCTLSLITILCLMLNESFTSPKTENNKVFGGKANFLMTGGKGILTYTLKSPEPGKFLSSSLIFFKQFNDPVKINISGNFVTK